MHHSTEPQGNENRPLIILNRRCGARAEWACTLCRAARRKREFISRNFNPPQGWLLIALARHSLQAASALTYSQF